MTNNSACTYTCSQVGDARKPLAQRLATFEGQVRHVTITSNVNRRLKANVESMSTMLARRVDAHHPGTKVWHLQCNFKPCADGTARVIWCSRLVSEPIDDTGFAIDRTQDGLDAPNSNTSSAVFGLGVPEKFKAPIARSWHGQVTPRDGSIFHMPLPGMTTFREPTWWASDQAVGITNLLPSATDPPLRRPLPRVWRIHELQESIYAASGNDAVDHTTNDGNDRSEAKTRQAALSAKGTYTEHSPRLPDVEKRAGQRRTPRAPPAPQMPRSMLKAAHIYETLLASPGLSTPRL